jgi:hypothetical protein
VLLRSSGAAHRPGVAGCDRDHVPAKQIIGHDRQCWIASVVPDEDPPHRANGVCQLLLFARESFLRTKLTL